MYHRGTDIEIDSYLHICLKDILIKPKKEKRGRKEKKERKREEGRKKDIKDNLKNQTSKVKILDNSSIGSPGRDHKKTYLGS